MHILLPLFCAGCLLDNIEFVSREMSIGEMSYILGDAEFMKL